MNLFWKRFFGTLQSAEKMEQAELDLIAAYKRFTRIAASGELAEYKKLYLEVTSASFNERKKVFRTRKYKDTEEYRKMKRFNQLDTNRSIKQYYDSLASYELKEFLAFKKTSEYGLLGFKKEVARDPNLKKFKRFEKSKAYKTYVQFHNSSAIAEYEALKTEVRNENFIANHNFWANSKRWLTTQEYRNEQRYIELSKSDDIKFYNKTDEKIFDPIKTRSLTFEDNFDGFALDASKWQNGFYHKAPLKRIYSFPNEKQAYSETNISVGSSELHIHTKTEQTEGAAWDTTHGFITKKFNFTSGNINAGDAFKQNKGLIRAKIAVKGSRRISHAFWMGAEGKLPLTNICQFIGKKIFVGNYFVEGNSVMKEARLIKGINTSKFYIYSLEWTEKELVWSVNNIEVFRTTRGVPNAAMFPAFNSFISENQKGGNGIFAVDWVRIYKKT